MQSIQSPDSDQMDTLKACEENLIKSTDPLKEDQSELTFVSSCTHKEFWLLIVKLFSYIQLNRVVICDSDATC